MQSYIVTFSQIIAKKGYVIDSFFFLLAKGVNFCIDGALPGGKRSRTGARKIAGSSERKLELFLPRAKPVKTGQDIIKADAIHLILS